MVVAQQTFLALYSTCQLRVILLRNFATSLLADLSAALSLTVVVAKFLSLMPTECALNWQRRTKEHRGQKGKARGHIIDLKGLGHIIDFCGAGIITLETLTAAAGGTRYSAVWVWQGRRGQ